jgi:hypothetical protein
MQVRILPCAPSMPHSSTGECAALNRETPDQHRVGLPIHEGPRRPGQGLQNPTSEFDSRLRVHASVRQRDRLPSSKRAIDVRVIAEAPSRFMEGQPARRRRSLLRMRHRQRCGDRVAGLPRGRGVTATCLASNQRSPGRHRASAPVLMLRWCNGQHLGPSNRRRRIETVTEYQCDAAPPARSPAFDAGQLGSTPRAAAIPILPAKTRFS